MGWEPDKDGLCDPFVFDVTNAILAVEDLIALIPKARRPWGAGAMNVLFITLRKLKAKEDRASSPQGNLEEARQAGRKRLHVAVPPWPHDDGPCPLCD